MIINGMQIDETTILDDYDKAKPFTVSDLINYVLDNPGEFQKLDETCTDCEEECEVRDDKIIETICVHLPPGWVIGLYMEAGAAWVSLSDPVGNIPKLPDSTDKTLTEQLNDALCVANGWS